MDSILLAIVLVLFTTLVCLIVFESLLRSLLKKCGVDAGVIRPLSCHIEDIRCELPIRQGEKQWLCRLEIGSMQLLRGLKSDRHADANASFPYQRKWFSLSIQHARCVLLPTTVSSGPPASPSVKKASRLTWLVKMLTGASLRGVVPVLLGRVIDLHLLHLQCALLLPLAGKEEEHHLVGVLQCQHITLHSTNQWVVSQSRTEELLTPMSSRPPTPMTQELSPPRSGGLRGSLEANHIIAMSVTFGDLSCAYFDLAGPLPPSDDLFANVEGRENHAVKTLLHWPLLQLGAISYVKPFSASLLPSIGTSFAVDSQGAVFFVDRCTDLMASLRGVQRDGTSLAPKVDAVEEDTSAKRLLDDWEVKECAITVADTTCYLRGGRLPHDQWQVLVAPRCALLQLHCHVGSKLGFIRSCLRAKARGEAPGRPLTASSATVPPTLPSEGPISRSLASSPTQGSPGFRLKAPFHEGPFARRALFIHPCKMTLTIEECRIGYLWQPPRSRDRRRPSAEHLDQFFSPLQATGGFFRDEMSAYDWTDTVLRQSPPDCQSLFQMSSLQGHCTTSLTDSPKPFAFDVSFAVEPVHITVPTDAVCHLLPLLPRSSAASTSKESSRSSLGFSLAFALKMKQVSLSIKQVDEVAAPDILLTQSLLFSTKVISMSLDVAKTRTSSQIGFQFGVDGILFGLTGSDAKPKHHRMAAGHMLSVPNAQMKRKAGSPVASLLLHDVEAQLSHVVVDYISTLSTYLIPLAAVTIRRRSGVTPEITPPSPQASSPPSFRCLLRQGTLHLASQNTSSTLVVSELSFGPYAEEQEKGAVQCASLSLSVHDGAHDFVTLSRFAYILGEKNTLLLADATVKETSACQYAFVHSILPLVTAAKSISSVTAPLSAQKGPSVSKQKAALDVHVQRIHLKLLTSYGHVLAFALDEIKVLVHAYGSAEGSLQKVTFGPEHLDPFLTVEDLQVHFTSPLTQTYKTLHLKGGACRFYADIKLDISDVLDSFTNHIALLKVLYRQHVLSLSPRSAPTSHSAARKLPHIRIDLTRIDFVAGYNPMETHMERFSVLGSIEQRERLARALAFEKRAKRLGADVQQDFMDMLAIQHQHHALTLRSTKTPSRAQHRRMKSSTQDLSQTLQQHIEVAWAALQNANLQSWRKKLAASSFQTRLFAVHLDHVRLAIKPLAEHAATMSQQIHGMDPATPPDILYDTLFALDVNGSFASGAFQLLNMPRPFLQIVEPGFAYNGPLIIAEWLPGEDDQVRVLELPLTFGASPIDDLPPSITVYRTVAPTRIYTDMSMRILSAPPQGGHHPLMDVFDASGENALGGEKTIPHLGKPQVHIMYGNCMQPAITELSRFFDGITKPSVDPSEPLPFWDKLKVILRGAVSLEYAPTPQGRQTRKRARSLSSATKEEAPPAAKTAMPGLQITITTEQWPQPFTLTSKPSGIHFSFEEAFTLRCGKIDLFAPSDTLYPFSIAASQQLFGGLDVRFQHLAVGANIRADAALEEQVRTVLLRLQGPHLLRLALLYDMQGSGQHHLISLRPPPEMSLKGRSRSSSSLDRPSSSRKHDSWAAMRSNHISLVMKLESVDVAETAMEEETTLSSHSSSAEEDRGRQGHAATQHEGPSRSNRHQLHITPNSLDYIMYFFRVLSSPMSSFLVRRNFGDANAKAKKFKNYLKAMLFHISLSPLLLGYAASAYDRDAGIAARLFASNMLAAFMLQQRKFVPGTTSKRNDMTYAFVDVVDIQGRAISWGSHALAKVESDNTSDFEDVGLYAQDEVVDHEKWQWDEDYLLSPPSHAPRPYDHSATVHSSFSGGHGLTRTASAFSLASMASTVKSNGPQHHHYHHGGHSPRLEEHSEPFLWAPRISYECKKKACDKSVIVDIDQAKEVLTVQIELMKKRFQDVSSQIERSNDIIKVIEDRMSIFFQSDLRRQSEAILDRIALLYQKRSYLEAKIHQTSRLLQQQASTTTAASSTNDMSLLSEDWITPFSVRPANTEDNLPSPQQNQFFGHGGGDENIFAEPFEHSVVVHNPRVLFNVTLRNMWIKFSENRQDFSKNATWSTFSAIRILQQAATQPDASSTASSASELDAYDLGTEAYADERPHVSTSSGEVAHDEPSSNTNDMIAQLLRDRDHIANDHVPDASAAEKDVASPARSGTSPPPLPLRQQQPPVAGSTMTTLARIRHHDRQHDPTADPTSPMYVPPHFVSHPKVSLHLIYPQIRFETMRAAKQEAFLVVAASDTRMKIMSIAEDTTMRRKSRRRRRRQLSVQPPLPSAGSSGSLPAPPSRSTSHSSLTLPRRPFDAEEEVYEEDEDSETSSDEEDADLAELKMRTAVKVRAAQFLTTTAEDTIKWQRKLGLRHDGQITVHENDSDEAFRSHSFSQLWVSLECIMERSAKFELLTRILSRTSFEVYTDQCNPLYVKRTSHHDASSGDPINEEAQVNSLTVLIEEVLIRMTSRQYCTVMDIVKDLLLYDSPNAKERNEQLKQLVIALRNENNLEQPFQHAYELQTAMLTLQDAFWIDLGDRFSHRLALQQAHSTAHFAERKALSEERLLGGVPMAFYPTAHAYHISTVTANKYFKRMAKMRHELLLLVEALTRVVNAQRDKKRSETLKWQGTIHCKKVEWTMSQSGHAQHDICTATLTPIQTRLSTFEDASKLTIVEIGGASIVTGLPKQPFTDLLAPYKIDRKLLESDRFNLIRFYFHELAPVAGIAVVDHMELNIAPILLQLSSDVVKLLVPYLFPDRGGQPVADRPAASSEVASSELSTLFDTSPPATLHTTKSADSLRHLAETRSMASSSLSLSGMVDAGEDPSTVVVKEEESKKGSSAAQKAKNKTDDLAQMKHRATSNRSYVYIKVAGGRHCISYQGPKEKNIEDLHQFILNLPTLEYRNKTWSTLDFLLAVKKDAMRIALMNTGSLIKEKFRQITNKSPSHNKYDSLERSTNNEQREHLITAMQGAPSPHLSTAIVPVPRPMGFLSTLPSTAVVTSDEPTDPEHHSLTSKIMTRHKKK